MKVPELTVDQWKVVEANLGLVKWTAKRVERRYPGHEFEDLVSDGTVGLMMAARGFDPSRGFKFSTYAVTAIERRIALGASERDGTNVAKAMPRSAMASMDAPLKSGDPFSDLLVSDDDPTATAERTLLVQRAIAVLPDKLRPVIPVMCGERTSAEVAVDLGVTRTTVYAMRDKAILLMRAELERYRGRAALPPVVAPKAPRPVPVPAPVPVPVPALVVAPKAPVVPVAPVVKRQRPPRKESPLSPEWRAEIATMLDTYEESRLWWAGVCVVAAAFVGPNLRRIKEATGVPIDCLNDFSFRLRKAGVWGGNHKANYFVAYEWLDYVNDDHPDNAARFQVGICLDAMVAVGQIARVTTEDGRGRYRALVVSDWFSPGMYSPEEANNPLPSFISEQAAKREKQRIRYIEGRRKREPPPLRQAG